MLEGGFFVFLDGASPWWWMAFGLSLMVIEAMLGTYFLMGPGLAAFTVGGFLFASPALGGTVQVMVFALGSLFYTVLGWGLLRVFRQQREDAGSTLNRRAAQMVGRTAVVTGPFTAGFGTVSIDGISWRARLAEGAGPPGEGALMRIRAVEGATVLVEPEG